MSKQKSNSAERAAHSVKSFNEVLKTDGPSVLILNSLGHAYVALGQFNEAAGVYRQSLVLDPNDHIAQWCLNTIKERATDQAVSPARVFEMA